MSGDRDSTLTPATDLQNIMGDVMHMATTMFPLKAATPDKGQTLPHQLWSKSVLHDVHTIRNRTKALRRLASLVAVTPPLILETLSDTEFPHHKLWLRVTTPLALRTVASPPIQNLEALTLTDPQDDDDDSTLLLDLNVDDTTPATDRNNRLYICLKSHRRTTRLLIKHARNQRRLKYGKALLRMFFFKPKVALQSILRTAAEEENTQPLRTNLSILKDDATGRLLVDPAEEME